MNRALAIVLFAVVMPAMEVAAAVEVRTNGYCVYCW